jgi:hypothetical protein
MDLDGKERREEKGRGGFRYSLAHFSDRFVASTGSVFKSRIAGLDWNDETNKAMIASQDGIEEPAP